MWWIDDALEGRLSVGKARDGSGPEEYILRISRKRVYQLQQFLEEEAEKGGDYFRVRMLVLLAEELRNAVGGCRPKDLKPSEARLLGTAQPASSGEEQADQPSSGRRDDGKHL